jgi:hypothetical protein
VWQTPTLILLAVVVGCGGRGGGGAVDDAARFVVRALGGADQQLDDASRLGRRLPVLLDEVPVAPRTRSFVDDAVNAIPVDKETTQDALRSVGWEVFCDLVTGEVPRERQQLTEWIKRKAAAFGVQFLGNEGLNRLVDGVLTASEDGPSNPNTDACNRLADSGL